MARSALTYQEIKLRLVVGFTRRALDAMKRNDERVFFQSIYKAAIVLGRGKVFKRLLRLYGKFSKSIRPNGSRLQ